MQHFGIRKELHPVELENPKRPVNMRELKFNYGPMKAHDYHVIMTQLLSVALRGILPPKVHGPIIKLCSFFNVISKKVIDMSTLEQLQRNIAETLIRLEMHFPPTYFDISLHLLIHLVTKLEPLAQYTSIRCSLSKD